MYWIDFCLNAQGTRGHSDFCSSHCLVSMAILWLLWVGHTAKITVPLSASSRTKNYGYQFLFFMNVTEFWVFIFSMQHTILIFSIQYSNNIYLWMWSLCFRFIFSKIIYINLKKKMFAGTRGSAYDLFCNRRRRCHFDCGHAMQLAIQVHLFKSKLQTFIKYFTIICKFTRTNS